MALEIRRHDGGVACRDVARAGNADMIDNAITQFRPAGG